MYAPLQASPPCCMAPLAHRSTTFIVSLALFLFIGPMIVNWLDACSFASTVDSRNLTSNIRYLPVGRINTLFFVVPKKFVLKTGRVITFGSRQCRVGPQKIKQTQTCRTLNKYLQFAVAIRATDFLLRCFLSLLCWQHTPFSRTTIAQPHCSLQILLSPLSGAFFYFFFFFYFQKRGNRFLCEHTSSHARAPT